MLDELPNLKYQDGIVDVDISNVYIALEKSDNLYARSIVDGHSHFKKQVLGHVNKMIHVPEFGYKYILKEIWAQNYEEEASDDDSAGGGYLEMIRVPFNDLKNAAMNLFRAKTF